MASWHKYLTYLAFYSGGAQNAVERTATSLAAEGYTLNYFANKPGKDGRDQSPRDYYGKVREAINNAHKILIFTNTQDYEHAVDLQQECGQLADSLRKQVIVSHQVIPVIWQTATCSDFPNDKIFGTANPPTTVTFRNDVSANFDSFIENVIKAIKEDFAWARNATVPTKSISEEEAARLRAISPVLLNLMLQSGSFLEYLSASDGIDETKKEKLERCALNVILKNDLVVLKAFHEICPSVSEFIDGIWGYVEQRTYSETSLQNLCAEFNAKTEIAKRHTYGVTFSDAKNQLFSDGYGRLVEFAVNKAIALGNRDQIPWCAVEDTTLVDNLCKEDFAIAFPSLPSLDRVRRSLREVIARPIEPKDFRLGCDMSPTCFDWGSDFKELSIVWGRLADQAFGYGLVAAGFIATLGLRGESVGLGGESASPGAHEVLPYINTVAPWIHPSNARDLVNLSNDAIKLYHKLMSETAN